MIKKILLLAFISFIIAAAGFSQQKDITLEDIFDKKIFTPRTAALSSMKDGIYYIETEEDSTGKAQNLVIYEYKTGRKVGTFLNGAEVQLNGKPLQFDDYKLSDDETKVLFSNDAEPIHRHSTQANFFVYDLKQKKLYDLSVMGKLQLCTLSPDGSRVAYVRNNNLYIWNLGATHEQMITQDGLKNHIINGAPDWVYEEEFSFTKGYEWSPAGNQIAWMRFDESKVKEYTLTYYDSLYPRLETYKYPKAGEMNSDVQVYVNNLVTGNTIKADLGSVTDQYIPRIMWTADENKLCVMRLNRLQNKVDLLLCDTKTGNTKTIFTEEDKTYIDIENSASPHFLKDGQHFEWMSYKDGYNNIYVYNIDGSPAKQITTDKKDVLAYYGYDDAKKTFYYQCYETKPYEKQVYSITWDGKKKLLAHPDGSNDPSFSEGFKYFVNKFSAANTVPVYETFSSDGKFVRTLEDNGPLEQTLSDYKISPREFLTIKTPDAELQAWMTKPPGFDASKKYPVLMYVYGGPANPLVSNSSLNSREYWLTMIAMKGYIVVCVDNRGTTKLGYDFLRCTYKELGKLETIDQVNAAKWLGRQPYVDASRIGIFGWSYGGYLTSLCMTKGADVFKTGIAVAPVTNWRFYDSIYTERYLRTPQENAKGYDDNSPINFADKIKGKFLIIAGTADDNVHFQNTMMFENRLIKSNIQFASMNYPNRAHGISGGGATMHLYTLMTDFILENL